MSKLRELKKVSTPWCASDVYVPYFAYPKLKELADRCTGYCPSGETFSTKKFWREAEKMYPKYVHESVGGIAKLPWGDVRDAYTFAPDNCY